MNKKIISSISALAMLAACMPIGMASAETTGTTYVLSNNAFDTDDIAMYKDEFGIDIKKVNTNAEYSWDTTDAEIKYFDEYRVVNGNFQRTIHGQDMISGGIRKTASAANQTVTWSAWDFGGWETMRFDLKHSFDVSAVDIWDYNQGADGQWAVGSYEIYAGNSQDDMQLVASGETVQDTTQEEYDAKQHHQTRTPVSFDTVNARYVDIKLKVGTIKIGENTYGGHQMRPAEMVIFGTLPYNEVQIKALEEANKVSDYLAYKSFYKDASMLAADLVRLNKALTNDSITSDDVDTYINEAEDDIANLEPAQTHYTLSGNNWQESDQGYYDTWDSSMTLTKLTTNSPSYQWINSYVSHTGANVDIYDYDFPGQKSAKSNDSACTKLTSGLLADNGGNNNVNGAWTPKGPSVSEFDLGGVYPVDRVDIIMKQYDSISTVEVYTSEDGVNYKKVATQAGNHESVVNNGDNVPMYFNSVKFPITPARYVRIIPWNQSWQQAFSEIAVFGYDSALAPLSKEIADAEAFMANENVSKYYTAESLSALTNAIADGKKLTSLSSEAEVNAAIANINSAKDNLATVYQRAVESSNKFVDSDKEYYKGLTPAIDISVMDDNNATYEWAEKHDPTLTNTDLDSSTQRADRNDFGNYGARLTNGNVTNHSSYYNTDTTWGHGEAAVAIFDLKDEKVIDRVDVFSSHDANKALGTIKVEVSSDGENYTEAATKSANGEIVTTQVAYMTPVTFAPVKARYVRVSFTKHSSAQLTNINEVVIFGIGPNYSVLYADINKELAKYDEATLDAIKSISTEDSYNNFVVAIEKANSFKATLSEDTDAIAAVVADIKAARAAVEYTIPEVIVTDNIDAEGKNLFAALYDGYGMENVGATYTIDASDKTEANTLVTNDPNHTVLTDGGIGSGANMTYGKFYGDNNATVTFDAMKDMYFTSADLYYVSSGTQNVANAKVEVSQDGETWTQVLNAESGALALNNGSEIECGGGKLGVIGGNFEPALGRYLRITATRASYQMVLAEMVVKAVIPKTETMTLSFENTTFETLYFGDSDEPTVTESFAGADSVYATGHLTNNTAEEVTCDVYTAFYAGGKLVQLTKADGQVTVPANGQTEWTTSLELSGAVLPEGTTAVNFAWDGTTPLAKAQR